MIPPYLGRILFDGVEPIGTCFQLQPGKLVTAWHVLDSANAGKVDSRITIDFLGNEAVPFHANVTKTRPEHDLALLTADASLPGSIDGLVGKTDEVALNAQATVTGVAEIADPGFKYRYLHAPGHWRSDTRRDDLPLGRFVSQDIMPGMSGAPVRLGSGHHVLGVISARYTSADGWLEHTAWVIRAEELIDFLDGANILENLEITGYRNLSHTALTAFHSSLKRASLDAQDYPLTLASISNLTTFGVKASQLDMTNSGIDYIQRDADEALEECMKRAANDRIGVLVVGASSAGKTHSAAQAAKSLWPNRNILIPQIGQVRTLLDFPASLLRRSLVWMDDIDRYGGEDIGEILGLLLRADAFVVATIRRSQFEDLSETTRISSPIGLALLDKRIFRRVLWKLEWSPRERARAIDVLTSNNRPGAALAVAQGTPLGAYFVAGPALVNRLELAETDEEWPLRYKLVRTVLDWSRTGFEQGIPFSIASDLLDDEGLSPEEQDRVDAREWSTQDVVGAGRLAKQSLLTISASQHRVDVISVHDFVLDHDRRFPRWIPERVWHAILKQPSSDLERLAVARSAYSQGRYRTAIRAYLPLAKRGDPSAMHALGVLYEQIDQKVAQSWLEKALAAGSIESAVNLAFLVERSDPLRAFDLFKLAANGDSVLGTVNFALRLRLDGNSQQRERSVEILLNAAKGGSPRAMSVLASIYLEIGDKSEAAYWITLAMETDAVDCGIVLGEMFESQNWPEAATALWERAESAGSYEAMGLLGRLHLRTGNERTGLDWLERGAKADDAICMTTLGNFLCTHEKGDDERGIYWLVRAARLGCSQGIISLAAALAHYDPARSKRWLVRAAREDHREAQQLVDENEWKH